MPVLRTDKSTMIVTWCVIVLASLVTCSGLTKEQPIKTKLSVLLEKIRRMLQEETKITDPDDDGDSHEESHNSVEINWEHARMYIINGTEERHLDDYRPWLNIPPEHKDGQTDEKMSHELKVLLNIEDEMQGQTSEQSGGRDKRKYVYPKGHQNLWPGAIVLYRFATDGRTFRNQESYDSVRKAIQWFEENSCVKWREVTPAMVKQVGHSSYVEIGGGLGCSAYLGRDPNGVAKRPLTLQEPYCNSVATTLHEMGHSLGMHHEHVRDDRDDHVKMVWEMIPEKPDGINWGKADTIEYAPYDLGSNMHYNLYAGSRQKGKMAMIPKNAELDFLATTRQPRAMSFYDLLAINYGYGCADDCSPMPQCLNGGFVNHRCQCVCPSTLIGNQCHDIETDTSCGGVINLSYGQQKKIQSPNYPREYDVGSNCGWLIRGPEWSVIELVVQEMDLPTGRAINRYTGQWEDVCAHHLEIRYNLVAQPGPEYCGTDWNRGKIVTTTYGESNLMLVRFNSTRRATRGKGFQATVRAEPLGCRSNPCQNSAVCTDSRRGPRCKCQKGFSGGFCEYLGAATFICNMDDFAKCPFSNDNSAILKWRFGSGNTISSLTGPKSGQGGKGQYMFIEASNVQQGHSARFMSSPIKPSSRCLKFFYNMYGRAIGSLEVKLLEDGIERVAWAKHGDQGQIWEYVTFTVNGRKPFRIIFEATRGSDYTSDIAVDSIKLSSGKCSGGGGQTPDLTTKSPTTGQPPTKITVSRSTTHRMTTTRVKPTPIDPSKGQITCTFDDKTLCRFQQVRSLDDFNWMLKQGQTPSENTGPLGDHTGSGYYLAMESSEPQLPGETAAIISNALTFNNCSALCLSFWYHIEGATPGTLSVEKIWKTTTTKNHVRLWESDGSTSSNWREIELTIGQSGPFYIAFKGTVNGWQGDIGLDDIRIKDGPCSPNSVANRILRRGKTNRMMRQ